MLGALGSTWGAGGHRKKLIKFKVTLKPGCPVSGLYASYYLSCCDKYSHGTTQESLSWLVAHYGEVTVGGA